MKKVWIISFFAIFVANILSILNNFKILSIFTLFILIFFVIYQFYLQQKKKTLLFPDRLSLLKELHKSKNIKYKTLILLNIDSFEDINDFFGYSFGDKVLKMVFYWLKNNLPDKKSKLYKLEADNYIIFTKAYKTKDELSKYLNYISSKAIDTNFTIEENEIDIGFTIGAAIDDDNLLKLTHTAYKKSKLNKTLYEIYQKNSSDISPQEKNIKINKIIKKAIQTDRVVPFFQPIYNIKSEKIDKYESLMRIKKDNNHILNPSEFLDIAKKSKMYPKLTREMFSKVTKGMETQKCEFSINISVDDILNKNTNSFILNKLEKSDIGSWLVFEILESEGIENYKEVNSFLKNIKSLGAKIAIDDFGSGYSNFEYILKLDVDFLKVDGSLIANIDTNEDMQIITSTIVEFAKKLKIKTIAEFVHNKNIYDIIQKLGFDYAQGYYIGKPDEKLSTFKDLNYLKYDNQLVIQNII